MEKVSTITSRSLVMSSTNIDTDQIIPARFLTTTTREGLGKALFADWRYDAEGQPRPDFLLNTPEAVGRTVLVAGRNFGCGSSREHAPWALVDFGLRAVISTEIADIFRSNALKNGLVPVIVDEDTHAWLVAHPGAEVTVDVERCVLSLPGNREVSFPLESFARYCLLNGVDELGFLLSRMPAIEEYERRGAK
ncbi:MAG: 3-isopropylmalate dehydratase small subunit [Steroidobacteraceae bacterium]